MPLGQKLRARGSRFPLAEDSLNSSGESCACNISFGDSASASHVGKKWLGLVRGRDRGLLRLLCAVLLPGWQRLHLPVERVRLGIRARSPLHRPGVSAARLLRGNHLRGRLRVPGGMRTFLPG